MKMLEATQVLPAPAWEDPRAHLLDDIWLLTIFAILLGVGVPWFVTSYDIEIGAALIGSCMAWAAGVGASAIRLEVRASNVAALALYRRLGFSTAGVRRAYYSAPVEDALLLQAPLVSQSPL